MITSDGSSTIHLPDWNENYHSTHGAIQEAEHVFIAKGLEAVSLPEISILEIGFGTGLNCFITFLESQEKQKSINYIGVEAFPVNIEEVSKLNYVSELKAVKQQSVFEQIHTSTWGEKHQLSTNFWLTKRKQFFKDITDINLYDLVYFDAFGAEHQPELWTVEIFKKMYTSLKVNGILVTYSAKGSVRRAMLEVGFKVERLDGPPGKREMLRATKHSA